MKYLSEIYGLVTKQDPITENGGLFFAHYLVLKKMLGLRASQEDQWLFLEKMEQARIGSGLYLRSKNHPERTVSHDEISGTMITSEILDNHRGITVLWYLKKHFGNYPATGTNKFYQPSNYYAWCVLCDSKWSFLFAILYTVSLLLSSNKGKEATSSKLIYMSELYIMKEKSAYSRLLWGYFSWRMKVMYGKLWVRELFGIYFKGEDLDHPLIKFSRLVK